MAESLCAQSLLDAAAAAAALGDARKAAHVLRQALAVQEAELGAAHGDVATTLNNLAVACEWLGDESEAERLYRRSYEVACRAFAPEHPQVVTTRRNLEEFCRARDLAIDPAPASEAAAAPPIAVASMPVTRPPESPLDLFGAESVDRAAAEDLERAEDVEQMMPPPKAAVAPSTGSAAMPRGEVRPSGRSTLRPPGAAAPARARWTPSPKVLALAAALVSALSGAIMLRGSSTQTDLTPPAAASLESRRAAGDRANTATAGPSQRPDEGARQPEALARAGAPNPAADRQSAEPGKATEVLAAPAAGALEPNGREDSQPASPAIGSEIAPPELASTDTASLRVVTARLCADLKRSGGQWTCLEPDAPLGAGRVYFYTRIASPGGAEIEHHWYRGDELVQRVPLRIAASAGDGYRTYSQQTVDARAGQWRVELRAGELVLKEEHFVVQ